MKWSAAVGCEVPSGVVTVTSTVPVPVAASCGPETKAAVLALGGLVTVICVAESAVIVPSTPPKRTTVAWASPVPVMVTVVPPAVLPLSGDTPLTAGSVTAAGAGFAAGRAGLDPDLAKTMPTVVPTITMPTAMAAQTGRERQSRERTARRCRGVLTTLVPWTAAGPPDGHRAASSSAASARCVRPRSCQSGP